MFEKVKSFISKNDRYFKIVAILIFYSAVSLLGAGFTDTKSEWYTQLKKPNIQPPSQYFGYIWSFLYTLLIVIGIVLVYKNTYNQKILKLFLANGILNVLWSYTFFTLQNPVASLIVILTLLIVVYFIYIEINKSNPTLSYFFIIYIIWLVFAGYLNYMILFFN